MPSAHFEQIANDVGYYGEDDGVHRLVVQTICRLPSDVAEFACERCLFLSVGETCHGMTVPGRLGVHPFEKRSKNMWLILLHEALPPEHAESIVAHEIAHAWLKHDRVSLDIPDDCESQAASLTSTWGFEGIGADAEYCEIASSSPAG